MAQPSTLRLVAEAITRLYALQAPATVEYPGFLCIAEKNINDDTYDSDAYWACGPSLDPLEAATGLWTGQLTHLDGTDPGRFTFIVRPLDQTPETIADAIYFHGICDLYSGGCNDGADCPRVRAK